MGIISQTSIFHFTRNPCGDCEIKVGVELREYHLEKEAFAVYLFGMNVKEKNVSVSAAR